MHDNLVNGRILKTDDTGFQQYAEHCCSPRLEGNSKQFSPDETFSQTNARLLASFPIFADSCYVSRLSKFSGEVVTLK